jgi:alkyl hydroperoxide reductase subunit AhpC
MPKIGDRAPDFTLKGAFKKSIADFSIDAYRGKWLILFFYPADFTFICPTEVSGFSKLAGAFRSEEAEILGISVDSVDSHVLWSDELGGVNYPLLSDTDKSVSRLYDVLDENEGVCLRATFIINPAGEITYLVVSHTNVGRSVEETVRVLKALRTERLCPSDWKPGEPTGDLNLRF